MQTQEMVLHGAQTSATTLQQLPFTLYKVHIATTGYSKVSRGLHFPLESRPLHRKIFEGFSRDSDHLVTPFMQAVNQTARHFATLREL